jgi:hypothetical protein
LVTMPEPNEFQIGVVLDTVTFAHTGLLEAISAARMD